VSEALNSYAVVVPTPAKRPRGRPRGRTKAETRELILTAAETCFAQWGYDAATNRQIAEAAGVTAGAIYQHFPSKLDLYLAVHHRAFAQLQNAFDRVPAETDTFRDGLLAMFEIARRFTAADPMLALFVLRAPIEARRHAELTEEVGGYTAPIWEAYRKLAQRAIDSGEIEGRSIETLTAGLAAMIQGLTQSAWYMGSTAAWGSLIDRYVELVPTTP
jgi:AcrR family transcriptional regulator